MRHIPDQVVTSVTSMWIAAHATRKHILGGGPGSEHMERFEGNGAGRRQRERNGSPWVTFREWMGDKILRNCTTREVGSDIKSELRGRGEESAGRTESISSRSTPVYSGPHTTKTFARVGVSIAALE